MIPSGYQQYYSYAFLSGSCIIWYGTTEFHSQIYFLIIPIIILICSKQLRIIACLLIGIIYAESTVSEQQKWQFPQNLVSSNHLLVGHIEGLVSNNNGSVRFRFKVREINHQAITTTQKIYFRLACYRQCADYKAGQIWQLLVRLKPPNGYINPNTFDYEKWLYSENIKATGYIVPSKKSKLLSMDVDVDNLRSQIRDYFTEHLQNSAIKGSVIALSLGDKNYLENREQELLAKNGLSHLMAISGMHIGLAAIPGFLLGGLLWRYSTNLQKFNKATVQWLCCLLPALFYTALSGFGLPAWRAIVMLIIFALAQITRSSVSTHSRFSLALWIILIFQPLAPLQTSFWLSFCATAILIFLSNLPHPKHPLMRLFKLQLQLYWMLLPIQLLIFGSSSMLSPLINLVAIPLVSLVLLPLLFIQVILIIFCQFIFIDIPTLIQMTNYLMIVTSYLFEQFWNIIYFIEPISDFFQLKLSGFTLVYLIAYPLFILLLFPLQIRLKLLISLIFLMLVMPREKNSVLKLFVLDVGQGLAAAIIYDNKVLIYDTAFGNVQSAVANMTILPWLSSIDRQEIEMLMVSHNDADHSGGIEALNKTLKINNFIKGPDVEITQSVRNKIPMIKDCRRGQSWQWKQLKFDMLSPNKTNKDLQKGNNSSCVLLLSIYNTKLLFTGDIEQQAEIALLDRYPNLSVDLLFAPHHGSKTSSTMQFIKQMDAKVAIISSGFLNRFNLPAKDVAKRYENAGYRLLNTASAGAIEVTINEQGKVTIKPWRIENTSLWTRH